MIRALAFLALGLAIWAGAYLTPGHTGAWGLLRGTMIAVGSITAGFWTARLIQGRR